MLCNFVFAGGGVRGIGHVGAYSVFEKKGYESYYLAGTSAGAIVATLIAAGYKSDELRDIMKSVDYSKFPSKTYLSNMGSIGNIFSFLFNYGIYDTLYISKWLERLLKNKNKIYFSDFKNKENKYNLQITATDITDNRLLIFPNDAVLFGIYPDNMKVIDAVIMSLSIPVFFKPKIFKDNKGKTHHIVDGGLLSNYPLFLFERSKIPTIGFQFVNNSKYCENRNRTVKNVIDYSVYLIETILGSQDNIKESIIYNEVSKTVYIPVDVNSFEGKKPLRSNDFDITENQINDMYNNGVKAAENYLKLNNN